MASREKEKFILILTVFVAGLCSIVYELLISTASSYFLGDSVKHFSLTIGIYLASMGIGSFLSRKVHSRVMERFIGIELLLGLVGGLSVPFLYFVFAFLTWYSFFMVAVIVLIGVLTGFEIPLLTRIMEKYYTLKVNLSNVLTLDSLGALVATLLFPFLLLPFLGTFQTSLVFGLINTGLGFLNIYAFRDQLSGAVRKRSIAIASGVALLLIGGVFFSEHLLSSWSNALYEDRVVYTEQTPYQRIVLTKYKDDIRMFLNGNLQFSSRDEYRYHEALVHVPLQQAEQKEEVLVLGGGDGLVSRELLKYGGIDSITVVDMDPNVFELARENPYLTDLNEGSLDHPRVRTVAGDAFRYLKEHPKRYDLILADLPDPNDPGLARLYSKEFYQLLRSRLKEHGIFVTQATSPYYAKKAFWCIEKTVRTAGFEAVEPYHVYIPSFGDWGMLMAGSSETFQRGRSADLSVPTRYLHEGKIPDLFVFGKDLQRERSYTASTLDRPLVLDHYMDGWVYY